MKRIAIAALLAAAGAGALAQTFPAKPVRIVVAFPAGGGTDIVARLLAPKLTDLWGQQVIVDNRAGASGVIGTEFAAHSAPDGHTLFLGTLGNLAVNQHLIAKMPVDPLRDFAPVTQVVAVHFVMVAHPSLPARNVEGLVAPAAVPRVIVGKIHADVTKVLQDAGVSERLAAMGATAVGSTPEQFGAVMRADSEKWAKLIREAGIRAE